MIDTSTFMWYSNHKTTTVWAHTALGEVLIADCSNKSMTTSSQRLNTILCAEAPSMFNLLNEVADSMNAEQFAEFTGILQRVHGKSDPE